MTPSRPCAASLLLVAGLLFATEAAPRERGDPPLKRRNAIMVDHLGRGVYTYDLDKDPSRSACDDMCRILWPPIFAASGAQPRGRLGIADRNDGSRQWTWDGKPLYRWISDRRRGEAGGDGVAGVWRLVRLPCGDGDDQIEVFTLAERACPKP